MVTRFSILIAIMAAFFAVFMVAENVRGWYTFEPGMQAGMTMAPGGGGGGTADIVLWDATGDAVLWDASGDKVSW